MSIKEKWSEAWQAATSSVSGVFASAPEKKKKRRLHDAYPTPSWATEILLKRYHHIKGVVFEPCVGDGDMARPLSENSRIAAVIANDLLPQKPADRHFDARLPEAYKGLKPDWIISNPPYSSAFEIVRQSYQSATHGCAFLLRLSFLEPTIERGPWLDEHPLTCCIVLPRISFTADGKVDSVTCAWMVWDKCVHFGNRSSILPDLVPPFQFVPRSEIAKKVEAGASSSG
jgi:hypothetical protein